MHLHQGRNSSPHVNAWLRRVYVTEYPANETQRKACWGRDCFQEKLARSLKNRGPDFLELLSSLVSPYVKLSHEVRLVVRFTM